MVAINSFSPSFAQRVEEEEGTKSEETAAAQGWRKRDLLVRRRVLHLVKHPPPLISPSLRLNNSIDPFHPIFSTFAKPGEYLRRRRRRRGCCKSRV